MIEINEKEYGLYYSVWAHCEFNDWVVANGEKSYVHAIIQKAVIMSKAYCDVHGGTPLSPKELMGLPSYVFTELAVAVEEQEKADSARTVETKEVKSKNAKGSAK